MISLTNTSKIPQRFTSKWEETNSTCRVNNVSGATSKWEEMYNAVFEKLNVITNTSTKPQGLTSRWNKMKHHWSMPL